MGGMNFVYELRDINKGHYDLLFAMQTALLTLPASLYTLFPVIVLIGSMMGLGSLATGSELVSMRASGVSLLRMAWAVAMSGILLALFSLLLGEVIAPQGEALANQLKVKVQSHANAPLADDGFWLRDGSSFIRADTVLTTRMLVGVEIYRFGDDHKLQLAVKAANARYTDDGWKLDDVRLTEFLDGRTESRSRPVMKWNTSINPHLLHGSVLPPEEQNLKTLHRTIEYLARYGLDSESQRLAFWRKLATPVLVLVMTIVAIPFVIGPLRTTDTGQRMFFGVVIGGICYFLNETSGYASQVYRFDPFYSAWLPTVLVTALAVFGMWYMNSPGRFMGLRRMFRR
jgi:lipopolysaccharide export system permease protein